MQLTERSQSPVATAEHGVAAENETIQRCDECGAPVDKDQRYCVACGAHRRHVNDPAARYLTQATARSRSRKTSAAARKAPGGSARFRGLGLALAIALVPVAAAAGVIAGRSSNNNDAQLVHALAQHQSAVGSTTTVPAATSSDSVTPAKAAAHAKSKRHHKSASSKSPSTKNAGKVLSKTQNGSAQQITGFKPTKTQVQQGQSETQKVQKSTGKSYVTGQNNLPSQVVVP
jgi:hypothetical protein